jgi:hypothetical protein
MHKLNAFRTKEENQVARTTGSQDGELTRDEHVVPQRGSFKCRSPRETNSVAEFYRKAGFASK